MRPSQTGGDYARIARIIEFINGSYRRQPTLEEMAEIAGLSKYHFQRLFRRWAGITPSQLVRLLTLREAKARLRRSESVLETSLSVGLSGPSRLHDLFVTIEAVSPGEYTECGRAVDIIYGVGPTPFGDCFVAATKRGICRMSFAKGRENLEELRQEWPSAVLREDNRRASSLLAKIFDRPEAPKQPFHLLVKGTNFQINVWRALLKIPPGTRMTYGQLAAMVEKPKAARAIGGAVGMNPLAYLIPCHRVIAATGATAGYRWGSTRKQAILAWEDARSECAESALLQG